jgi:hypothetical protein
MGEPNGSDAPRLPPFERNRSNLLSLAFAAHLAEAAGAQDVREAFLREPAQKLHASELAVAENPDFASGLPSPRTEDRRSGANRVGCAGLIDACLLKETFPANLSGRAFFVCFNTHQMRQCAQELCVACSYANTGKTPQMGDPSTFCRKRRVKAAFLSALPPIIEAATEKTL